jgi:hypothetical protein
LSSKGVASPVVIIVLSKPVIPQGSQSYGRK